MSEFLPPPDPSLFPVMKEEYLRTIDSSVSMGRMYFAAGSYPTTWREFRTFGPTHSRFDQHPDPPGVQLNYGVMYVAPALVDARGRTMSALQTALLECFRDVGVVDAVADDPYFVLFHPTRPLKLLDLADSDWVTVAGGNVAISSGPRDRSREWARAIYSHYQGSEAVDGVLYTTSNRPASRSVALWERAADALPDRPVFNEALSHLGLRSSVEAFAHEVGLGLIV